jgi:hypothetical protein
MNSDPIVAEIRKVRELRAARFGFDIRKIVKDVQARDASGDREVVRRQPRRAIVPVQSDGEAITRRST